MTNQMLEFERLQHKLGKREVLPCDRRKEHVKKNRLTCQQKIILQSLNQLGEATAFELIEAKNLNAHSVTSQITHLANANLVEKVRRVPAPKDPTKKKSGNADCWVYKITKLAQGAVA